VQEIELGPEEEVAGRPFTDPAHTEREHSSPRATRSGRTSSPYGSWSGRAASPP